MAHSKARASEVRYDVFLSFCGVDTRYNFMGFLNEGLRNAKIRVFRDEDEIKVGDKISEKILRAIDNSTIYIPIISQTYPDRKWCLIELERMMNYVSRSKGRKKIFPIFFKVEPGDVKHRTPHPENPPSEVELRAFKEALAKVGRIKGWKVEERQSQEKIVKLVVQKVLEELGRKDGSQTKCSIELDDLRQSLEGSLYRAKREEQGMRLGACNQIQEPDRTTRKTSLGTTPIGLKGVSLLSHPSVSPGLSLHTHEKILGTSYVTAWQTRRQWERDTCPRETHKVRHHLSLLDLDSTLLSLFSLPSNSGAGSARLAEERTAHPTPSASTSPKSLAGHLPLSCRLLQEPCRSQLVSQTFASDCFQHGDRGLCSRWSLGNSWASVRLPPFDELVINSDSELLPPPMASSVSSICSSSPSLRPKTPPASATMPSASGRREAASVSFPSGAGLPAVDRVLSLSLARSVTRGISVDLGRADDAAKKERRKLEGWGGFPLAVDEVRGLATPAPELGLFLGREPNRVHGRLRGGDRASVPGRVQGDGGAGEGRDRKPGPDEGHMVGHY